MFVDLNAFYASAAAASFMALLFIVAVRLPHLIVIYFLILFTFLWRTAATLYIDLFGPIYATQLERTVGPGSSSVVQALSYLVTLIPFLVLFRSAAMRRLANEVPEPQRLRAEDVTLGDVLFYVSLLYVGALYFELVRIGIIPLFASMERFDYTHKHASVLHVLLVGKGNLMAFTWGAALAYGWIREGRLDLRFVFILGAVLVYSFLTGNRFSAFYSFGSFFIAPFAAVAVILKFRASGSAFTRITRPSRPLLLTTATAMLAFISLLVSAGLYNSLVNSRSYEAPQAVADFVQRALVQPSEMWWVSYERIFIDGDWKPRETYHALFINPINPDRNTTPQLLMSRVISPERTYHHILNGFQFAGGFPEVFFELFGAVYAWLMLALAGTCAACLCYIALASLLSGALCSAVLAATVMYGFQVMYIGGMLNFVTPVTFWLKCVALCVALLVEWGTPMRIMPWHLFRRMPTSAGRIVASGS